MEDVVDRNTGASVAPGHLPGMTGSPRPAGDGPRPGPALSSGAAPALRGSRGWRGGYRGSHSAALWTGATWCLITLLVLLAARAASGLMVPLATALVLALLCSAPVEWLQRHGLPPAAGAALVMLAGAMGLTAAMAWAGADVAGRTAATQAVDGLAQASQAWSTGTGAMPSALRWLEARVAVPPAELMARMNTMLSDGALSIAAAMILAFFALLSQRSIVGALLDAAIDPRARLRRLAALHDARRRVADYFVTMAVANLALAIASGLVLALLGLPSAVHWAASIFLVTFIPYVGPLLIAVLLLGAGYRQFGSSWAALAPSLAFLVLHAIESTVVQPWVLGSRLRVRRVGLLVAILVGGWAWGVAGGVLAVPILLLVSAGMRGRPGSMTAALLRADDAGAPLPGPPVSSMAPVASVASAAPVGRLAPVAPVAPAAPAASFPAVASFALEPGAPLADPAGMRIAVVTETYPPELNGVALTVARTVDHLRARGHHVLLIRPRQPGERCGSASGERRVPGFPIPMYPDMRFGVAGPSGLVRQLRAEQIALVHVATPGPLGWAAISAARQLGLAITADFRTNFHQYSRHYRLGWLEPSIAGYLRSFHNRADRNFVPTVALRREMASSGFERLSVVGRGVDTARFSPRRRDPALRATWLRDPGAEAGEHSGAEAGDDAVVALYVGRLAVEKNVGLALRAFTAAHKNLPSARMVVVGDGPLRKGLRQQHPEVLFVGARTGDELAACYASADLFIFPSLSETFGNVTLEALASGLLVVAFDMAAAGQYVVDGVNGRLIAPGDEAAEAAYTAAVCEMMSTAPSARAAMRQAACNAAQTADWPHVLQRFEDQLTQAMKERSHAATTACIA